MKFAIASIAANMVSLACVIGAIMLMMNGREGWDWLLLIALLTKSSVSFSSKKGVDE